MADRGGVDLDLQDLELCALVYAREGRVVPALAVAERVQFPSMRMLYALADMVRRLSWFSKTDDDEDEDNGCNGPSVASAASFPSRLMPRLPLCRPRAFYVMPAS